MDQKQHDTWRVHLASDVCNVIFWVLESESFSVHTYKEAKAKSSKGSVALYM